MLGGADAWSPPQSSKVSVPRPESKARICDWRGLYPIISDSLFPIPISLSKIQGRAYGSGKVHASEPTLLCSAVSECDKYALPNRELGGGGGGG
jgi:hypothetical protein